MERVKVKYCYNEDELNKFLVTLHTDRATYPQLDSVHFIPRTSGRTGEYGHLYGEVIAAVQYYIDIKEEKDNGLNF